MPGAGAAHVHDPRATGTERLEILLEEVLQGQDRVLQEQRAMAERLARLEAKLDDLKAKNKGGAIEKFDWFAFAVEVARYERMDCDDGIPSRDELRKHMEAWIAVKWPDGGPTERILRARLALICKELNLA